MNDRQKILIVDDKDKNLFALEKVLEKMDADIIRATCGNDALTASINHEFALAILDIQMPQMDGYELAEFLRADKKTRDLPIIFLTAVYSDSYHVFKGYEAGAVDFLTKPYKPQILLAKVMVFLQLGYQRQLLQNAINAEKAKNHLENILLSMIDAVLVVSEEGIILTVNDAALSLTGYAGSEIIGLPFVKLFENIGSSGAMTGIKAGSANDHAPFMLHNKEMKIVTRYQETIPVMITGSVFHNKDNQPLGTVIVARDIREQIKAQKALQASEERYRTLYETSRDGIAFSDVKGGFIHANPAFLEMTGYEMSALANMSCHQLVPGKWHDADVGILNGQILPRGDSRENEKEFIRKDGSVFPVAVRNWLSRDDAGTPNGMWMLVRDITVQQQLEQQRIMTEKITALGMLAGGMAHELNNPMMGINGFIEYCLKHTQKEDRRYEILEDAGKETKRCMDLVKNLLTFSHTEPLSDEQCQWVDIETLFDRVLRLLAYRIEKDNVLVIKQISVDSNTIYTQGNSLQQVFLNFMTNALDAVSNNAEKKICFTVDRIQDNVRIVISDTGTGILPEHMDRIFDPFFTTKPVGKGTGLGLCVSKSIVESLGGKMCCESMPGKGTKFEVLLPGRKNEKLKQEGDK